VSKSVGNTEIKGKEMSVRSLWASLWVDRWLILIITLLVFNIVIIRTLHDEHIFEAHSTVQINVQGEQIPFDMLHEKESNLGNEIVMLESRAIAYRVADELLQQQYLDKRRSDMLPLLIEPTDTSRAISLLSPEEITERIENAVKIEHITQSDIVRITARSADPREAALLANTYAQVYYQTHLEESREHLREMREFLEYQFHEKGKMLRDAEERFQRYMEHHDIVIVDEESQMIIDQIAHLEAMNDKLTVEIQKVESGLVLLHEQLDQHGAEYARELAFSHDPYIKRIQEQIPELELHKDLTRAHNPRYEEDERSRNRIHEIEARLTELRNTLHKTTEKHVRSLTPGDEGFLQELKQRIAEEQITLQGLRIQKESNRTFLQQYEDRFEKLPEINLEYARLERARGSAEKLYLMIEEKYNEMVIAEQSEFGSVAIIDEAQIPSSPVKTNIPMTMGAGIFFGLGIGVGFVVLKGALTTVIRIPEDLKSLNLRNLSTIPLMHSEVKGKINNRYLITISSPLSYISESFRALRINLQYSGDKPLKSMVITSPNPGDGKTVIAANLAVVYAQAGTKVLLLDADMRKPTIHRLFGLDKKPGLVDILSDNSDVYSCIQPTTVDNLHVITAGGSVSNSADVTDSNVMKNLIHKLAGRYEVLIFDSPPVLTATDAAILSRSCDGVIVVASSRSTTAGNVIMTRESIERVHGRVIGSVLNRFNDRDLYTTRDYYRYYKYNSKVYQ
jgi:capsular exopolysaccharide synthesis family protein